MARIRSVKPEVFLHEELFDLEVETGLPVRLAFIGLWTQCDREGRFKWRPRMLKSQILPHDNIDFSRVLHALTTRGFVVKYACQGDEFGFVPSWSKHQIVNNRESASSFPDPYASDCEITTSTRAPRVPHACPTDSQHCAGEGKGKEGKGKEGNGDCTEPDKRASVPDEQPDPIVMSFPVVGTKGSQWHLTKSKVVEYQQSFPAVDVVAGCRHARQWCIDNPRNRKTPDGMGKFLTGWLARDQNKGGTTTPAAKADPRGNLALRQRLLDQERGGDEIET